MKKLPKLFALAEALDRGHKRTADIRRIRGFLLDEKNNWHVFAEKLSQEVDPGCLRKVMECFFVNSMLDGIPRAHEVEEKYDINVPWVILMDPTSASVICPALAAGQLSTAGNITCPMSSLTPSSVRERIRHTFRDAGGEPLVRKKDIISLCRAYQDCYFFAFTNGTLVDDEPAAR